MAKKELLVNSGDLTTAVVKDDKKYDGPTVRVHLKKIEDPGDGTKVDQYEHITLANETGKTVYRVQRGVGVDIPVPVFLALYERYGKDLT